GDIISIYRSEPFFIEIMPKNINKADSLDRVLKGMGMSSEQEVCCGDGYNDISMIKYAKVGVAMGNAQPAVKEAADYIAPTNDEDGVVDVIEKFFE
ncbi:MAG: HAD hydrolase family protein, partial [Lachnospiraceae bacterium]|nr:HAD hydrolase family protein [Lachnospiraceae bacterium]